MITAILRTTVKVWIIVISLSLLPHQWSMAGTGFEYRFERQVPLQTGGELATLGIRAIALDGSFWTFDSGKLVHLTAEGTVISRIGSGLEGYQAMAVAIDGSLWVTSTYNNQISHFRADGSLIARLGTEGSEPGQLKFPEQIDVAVDGSLWVIDSGNNRIQHLSPEGHFLGKIVGSSTKDQPFYASSIDIAVDGSVWITSNASTPIQHFTADGRLINEFGAREYDYFGERAIGPNYVAVSSDGSIWVSGGSKLQHYSEAGELLREFPIPYPRMLAISVDASIWVEEYSYYRNGNLVSLHHLNADGTLLKRLANPSYNSPTNYIDSFTIATDNTIWISTYNQLSHLTARGELLWKKDLTALEVTILRDSMTAGRNGSIWVLGTPNSSYNAIQVRQINASGDIITRINAYTPKSYDEHVEYTKIALAADGTVWLLFSIRYGTGALGPISSFMQHFSATGVLLDQKEIPNMDYDWPIVRLSPDGSIWRVDKFGTRLQHLTAEGVLIQQINNSAQPSGQFKEITDITVAADGSVWIADAYNDRLLHIKANGELIETLRISVGSEPGQVVYQSPNFDFSLGTLGPNRFFSGKLAVTADGSLWMVNYDNLQKFVPRPRGTTSHPYKAVILAGGATQTGDAWNGAWQSALLARKALLLQGFRAHEEVTLLTAGNTQMDLDQNSQVDDLSAATKTNLKNAITEWAKDTSDLVLYLVATGKGDHLQLNATETLSANELGAWLAELEPRIPGHITVILEADAAGGFLPVLSKGQRARMLIASTQTGQLALMAHHGVNSFSYAFWNRIAEGSPLASAVQAGSQAISTFTVNNQPLQAPFDANGDGLATNQDQQALEKRCLGNCNVNSPYQPPRLSLAGSNSVTLQAASSLNFEFNLPPITTTLDAWALIQRPGTGLVLEQVPLTCDIGGHCRGRYHRFDQQGSYRINGYALDLYHSLSDPVQIVVHQPETRRLAPVEYDAQLGLLYVYDVDIAGQHYQATLTDQQGQFRLKTFAPTTQLYDSAAQFNPLDGKLNVPYAQINGQAYQGTMGLSEGHYLFQLQSLEPLSSIQ